MQESDPKFTEKKLLTKIYHYGNLSIHVRFGKIISVENHKGEPNSWHIDWKRYEQLSKQLGIEDYKSRPNKKKRKPS